MFKENLVTMQSSEILIAWLGASDLKASRHEAGQHLGPIAQAIEARHFASIHLLCNYPILDCKAYKRWLQKRCEAEISLHPSPLTRPTMLGEIFEAASQVLRGLVNGAGKTQPRLVYHLSPGTPQMAIIWMMLANSHFPAELIESSVDHGVNQVSCPFEITLHYLPDITAQTAEEVLALAQGLPPAAPEFDAIVHRCRSMQELLIRARRAAILDFPILLEGESGTGKELLARAIHRSSRRSQGPFVAVNCGAIPAELVESEFFGHEKGAFTGATQSQDGYFMAADGGTLFLDEIGELPLAAQVKLLRVLQERKIQRLGGGRLRGVDFRIVAATNRDLQAQVIQGNFREDLYHRLAVALLYIPALRHRLEDFPLLVDHALDRINEQGSKLPGWHHKKISKSAIKILMEHSWRGNIRELLNILTRCAIWSPAPAISEADVRAALLPRWVNPESKVHEIPETKFRDDQTGANLPTMVADFARMHLEQALRKHGGNKARAARELGLPSYQTFTNWCHRFGVNLSEASSEELSK